MTGIFGRCVAHSLLALCLAASRSRAQDTIVATGARIRIKVTPPGEYRSGVLTRLDADSLVMRVGSAGERLAIPRSSLEELDVSLGGSGSRQKHILIGGAIGLAWGVALGASQKQDHSCPAVSCESGRTTKTVGSGLIGLLLGGYVGGAFPSERWKRLICSHVALNGDGQSLGVGFRIALPRGATK